VCNLGRQKLNRSEATLIHCGTSHVRRRRASSSGSGSRSRRGRRQSPCVIIVDCGANVAARGRLRSD
jgi:hypothetical protein